MKYLIIFFVCSIISANLCAQEDTTRVKILNKNIVTVVAATRGTTVKVGGTKGIAVITDDWGDTTTIKIGRRTFYVVDGQNGTRINVSKKWKQRFNPHWAGIEVGMNMFSSTDYSMYNENYAEYGNFFDLIHGKSLTWNINFAEWAFRNRKNNVALVTGMGLSFSDYRFDKKITIEKDDSKRMIVPFSLEDLKHLKKSKLTMTYFTVPLMLEVQTPLRLRHSSLYVAGGVIGGLHLGSHTKYKYNGHKEKERSNFYLNKLKCDLTCRMGLGDFCVFMNYGVTPLFRNGKGPKLKPMMIGVSFPNI